MNETDRTVVDNTVNVLRASMVLDIRERQGNCASSRFEIGDPNTSLNETIRATLAAMWVAATCSPSVVDKNEPNDAWAPAASNFTKKGPQSIRKSITRIRSASWLLST